MVNNKSVDHTRAHKNRQVFSGLEQGGSMACFSFWNRPFLLTPLSNKYYYGTLLIKFISYHL